MHAQLGIVVCQQRSQPGQHFLRMRLGQPAKSLHGRFADFVIGQAKSFGKRCDGCRHAELAKRLGADQLQLGVVGVQARTQQRKGLDATRLAKDVGKIGPPAAVSGRPLF
jgi:hypothetical protein